MNFSSNSNGRINEELNSFVEIILLSKFSVFSFTISCPKVVIENSFILGIFAKKSKFISNNLIPIQNILIGVIVAIIEWIITKDFKVAIALSGLLAGGAYDVLNNINKMIRKGE